MKLSHVFYLKRIFGSQTHQEFSANCLNYAAFIQMRTLQSFRFEDPLLIFK